MNDVKFWNVVWIVPTVIFGSVAVSIIQLWIINKVKEWFNGGDD